MRKLKLQMHLSIDNHVNMEKAGKDFKWDNEVIEFCVGNLDSVDTLVLGRKTANDLIPFWDNVATDPKHEDYSLGKRISELKKIVFTKVLTEAPWRNATVNNGDLKTEIGKLKSDEGKDLLVYGGADFVRSLIETGLVDEYHFLLDPFRLGDGPRIFNARENVELFTLIHSRSFPSGIVLLQYKPK